MGATLHIRGFKLFNLFKRHTISIMEANPEQTIEQVIEQLTLNIDQTLLARYNLQVKDQDNKALKKKLKKQAVEAEDSNEKALEKLNKLLDDLYKQYEATGKQFARTKSYKTQVDGGQSEKEKMGKQKAMFQNLFTGFKKRYDDEIAKAQEIEKDEENKRKAIIEELQERIKVIQTKYEEAGKAKIEKYKENETLKHELSKYEPHLIASQSLADAQLKKKSIEIEIQMTTLKQKIEMMDNFKNMRVETEEKLKKSKEVQEKIGLRLQKLEKKEEEHKMSLAKAHLVFEDYKKAFNVLKDTLPKKERDALLAKDKLKKSHVSLDEIRKKIQDLEKEEEKEVNSLNVLLNLEKNLQKQLTE